MPGTIGQLLRRAGSHPASRRLLQAGLSRVTSRRALDGTPFHVTFPARQHLGLFFSRSIAYEPEVTCRIPEWLPENGVAIDVGANLGIYTLLMRNAVGAGGLVLSCEPDPQNVPWLRRNLDDNGVANVRLHPIALGNRAGELPLHQDLSTSRTSSLMPDAWRPDAGPRPVVTVRVDTLDRLAADLERLDFVKIDTEGFESAVLGGGLVAIARLKPRLLIEVSRANRAVVEGLLTPLGYRFHDPFTAAPLQADDWPPNVLARLPLRS
jgi:FkbM family methyltransferase